MKTLMIFVLFIGLARLEETCNVRGQCVDGKLFKVVTKTKSLDCLKECKTLEECNYFTFNSYPDSSNCQLLKNCDNFGDGGYSSRFLSGSRQCPSEFCEVRGVCQVRFKS